MKWGVIDVAQESGGQIVPTVLEYSREQKKCFARFGEPMVVSQDDSKTEAITALWDTMTAMRWAFWERNGLFSRAELDLDAEQKKLFYAVKEYPPIDWEYESSCIYHPHTEPEDVWQSVVNIKNVHAGNITHIIYAKKWLKERRSETFSSNFKKAQGCLLRRDITNEELWVNQILKCGYYEFYFSKRD